MTEFSNVEKITIQDKTVRYLYEDSTKLYSGNDICEAINYISIGDAIKAHVKDKDKIKLRWKSTPSYIQDTLWGEQDYSNKTLINESGVKSLLLSSRMPNAMQVAKELGIKISSNDIDKIKKDNAVVPSNHVYVVQQIGIDDIYKIGIAKDIKKRLAQFNNAAPIGIKVICCIESKDTLLIEKYLHNYYKDYNSNLEWYKLNDDQLQELTTYLKTYEQIEQGNFVKTKCLS